MKYYIYIGFFIVLLQVRALSKDANLFSKEFDHIYLLESVLDDAANKKYALKIVKKYKYSEEKRDIAIDRVKKLSLRARENKRYLFGYKIEKIEPEVVWLYELDGSGDFTFEKMEKNQKAGKKYKLNIADLQSVKPNE